MNNTRPALSTNMKNLRKYGNAPFGVAVIHGGPGAPGEIAPVARELAKDYGVLEPLQTASSLQGQVDELKAMLEQYSNPPVTLIGHSWGAMLSFIFAARCPSLVRKLILVSSGAFEDKYAESIMATRLGRLTGEEKTRVETLLKTLDDPSAGDKNRVLAELGNTLSRVDSFDPLPGDTKITKCQYDIYESVWREAKHLRTNGELLALGSRIECPVVAIHGDHDPHPAAGVKVPLTRTLKDFRFVLLDNCGHRPWIEKTAKDRFYSILRAELR